MRLLLTALLTLALGWPVVRAVRAPRGPFGWLEALVLAGGIGAGIAALLQLLALHVTNAQPWALEAVVAVALLAVLPRAARGGGQPSPPPGDPRLRFARLAVDVALGLCVAALLAEQVRTFLGLTLLAPLGQWDGKAIWNLKARFLFRAGPDWRDVTAPGLALSHVDYPWLVPLAVLRGWQAHGQESAALAAALAGAFGLWTLVLVVCALRRERGPLAGWVAGLLLLATPRLVTEASAQQADVPVAFFVVAMLGTLGSWNGSARAPLAVAGLCGSLAAWTKNEGSVWLLATGGVLLLAGLGRPGLRGKLGPAGTFGLGALPGALVLLFFKIAVAGPNDLAGMTSAGTLAERWLDPARWNAVAAGLWKLGLELVPPCRADATRIGLAALVVLPVLLGARLRGRHPRAALVTAVVAACSVGLWAIFMSTPVNLDWHLKTSAGRLLLQLWPAAVLASSMWAADPWSRHARGSAQERMVSSAE